MKVLVTGGGGFLGSHVARALLDRGDEVRILARKRYEGMERLGARSCQGDIADPGVVSEATRGVESIFHVAGKPGIWGRRESFFRTNVLGTKNIVEAAEKEGVSRLVYTSTPSVVYGDQPIEGGDETLEYAKEYLAYYPETKAEAERIILAAHRPGQLHTVALRPHLIFGPGDNHLIPRLVHKAERGRLARVGDGKNRVSVSYVENTAAAHLQAHDAIEPNDSAAGGRAYFINEEEPVVLWSFLDRILEGLGAPKIHRRISYGTAKWLGAALELSYKAMGLSREPPMTRFLAAQLATSHWFVVDRAKHDFGFEAKVSLDEGLQRLFSAFR